MTHMDGAYSGKGEDVKGRLLKARMEGKKRLDAFLKAKNDSELGFRLQEFRRQRGASR